MRTIEGLLQSVQERQSEVLDISQKTYRVRCRDLKEFNQKALRLMESNNPLQTQYRKLEVLWSPHSSSRMRFSSFKQKVRNWQHTFLHRLQRVWNSLQRTYTKLKDQYLAKK